MDQSDRKQPRNPRKGANFLSVLTFAWTWPLFLKGLRKTLDIEDLYEPLRGDHSQRLGDKLEAAWYDQVRKANRKGGTPSLFKALVRVFWTEYVTIGILQLVSDVGIRLTQPLLLGQLLSYFSPSSSMPKEHALMYAGGILLCIFLNIVIQNNNMFRSQRTGMQIRVACCSLIFRKAIRLSRTAFGDTASGQVVNLLSNDVSRFDIVSLFINFLWTAPLLAIIVAYLLYSQVQWAGFVGIAVIFIIVPLQSYTGKLSSKFRYSTALRTDERVRLMDEIVTGVQVIKMYAWEKPFTRLISEARRKEIREILKVSMVRGVFMTFMMFTTRVALFASLITYVLSGDTLKASFVFVVQSYFNTLSFTMGSLFVRGISEVAECLVSIKRLQKFMLYEEVENEHRITIMRSKEEKNGLDKSLSFQDNLKRKLDSITNNHVISKVEVNGDSTSKLSRWLPTSPEDTLKNINLTLRNGELLAVIGPVGSGKSSLLQAVLNEIPARSGKMDVNAKVSYACQEPWLFAASIRQNITFGSPFNRKRYDSVVKACALLADFAQLPFGDLTLVGERGASLSGGQRARVNLARAVYREADLYLLDDPLSAVDTHVGKHLFEECITNFLAGKTRILVTHQVQYLRDVSRIAIMNNGAIQMQGTFSELLNSDVDYAQMLHLAEEEEEEDDEDDDDLILPEDSKKPLVRALRQLSRVSVRSMKESSRRSSVRSSVASMRNGEPLELEEENAPQEDRIEESTKGKVKGSLFFRYFLTGTNIAVVCILALLFIGAQVAGSAADFFVGYWTNQEELRVYRQMSDSLESEDTATSSGIPSTKTFVYIYSGIIVSLFFVAFSRSFVFYYVCMRCSQRLHDNMFSNLIRATMRFFNTNPSGRVLNRFSKDLGSVDELLPKAILDASQILLSMMGFIVVAISVDWIFTIPVIILMSLFYITRFVYLKTARDIKRLEGMTRSPVFTHLNATIQGLSTIRAFNAQGVLREEFDRHQDLHSSAWFMFIFSSTAFGMTLDLMSWLFIFTVTFSFLVMPDGAFGGDVGLAITQSMAMTGMVQYGMRQSAEVSSQLLSVERVLEYTNLPRETNLESDFDNSQRKSILKSIISWGCSEPKLEIKGEQEYDMEDPSAAELVRISPKNPKVASSTLGETQSPDWPTEGHIELRNVWMRYGPDSPPVLKGLNLIINPREKVGVVGRTGAGKSSLISALFRLAYVEGHILLDGVDSSTVALQLLRSRISIIPQDPFLFSGTLRRNLDPFDEYADHQIWAALQDVDLREVAAENHGLEMRVADCGSNFSVGQRQLICLARAILRGNKVLMLDEATANVDPQTDALIQRTIRTKFAACTVLTVAHRLHTIMDSDKVLVMDAGRAAEFDHPHMLIQRQGIFYSLVQETGHQMAENLARVARENNEEKAARAAMS